MFKLNAASRLKANRLIQAETLKEYQKTLRRLGIKKLGSGKFADVFQHPTMPDVVVKLLTEDDEAYAAYVKFSEKNKANKYVPKILQVVSVDAAFDTRPGFFDTGNLRLIFMEKLTPMKTANYLKFGNYLLDTAGHEGDLKHARFMASALNNPLVWEDLAAQNKDKDLRTLASFIKTHMDKARLDMHKGNFMMRGNQPILTDPFSTY